MVTSDGGAGDFDFELARALGRPRSVLDVGCGLGREGELARAKGARVVGVESSPALAAAARTRLDEVIEGPIEKDATFAMLGSRRFDVILLRDVLEHAGEPRAALARFVPLLEDGGRLLLSQRLRSFSDGSAVRLVEESGLEVLWVGLNPIFASKMLAGGHGDDPSRQLKSPLYQMYLKLLQPVEGQLARFAPGISLRTVIVARKIPERRKLSCTVGMLSMNEESAVGRVIDQIREHAPDAEILLVDSSKDRTPEIAQEKGARVIRQVPPRGYGPAMDALLYGATGDVVITMDCDGTYPAERIRDLRALVEGGADLVNGSRTRHRPVSMPFTNFLANRVFATAANLAHGVHTTDVHSGMRAYRTSMLRSIDVDPAGPALPVELLVVPATSGFRVVDVEIPYHHRIGVSSLQRWQSTVWTFRRLARSTPGPRARRDRWTTL